MDSNQALIPALIGLAGLGIYLSIIFRFLRQPDRSPVPHTVLFRDAWHVPTLTLAMAGFALLACSFGMGLVSLAVPLEHKAEVLLLPFVPGIVLDRAAAYLHLTLTLPGLALHTLAWRSASGRQRPEYRKSSEGTGT